MRDVWRAWTLKRTAESIIKSKTVSYKMRFNDKECANLLLGVLKQAALDKKLSYVSSVGADYSHLTDDGIALLTKTAQLVFINLLKNEQDLLDEKLKEKFMKDLAGK